MSRPQAHDRFYSLSFNPDTDSINLFYISVSAEDGDYNQRLSFSVDDDHFRADTVVQTANGATAVIRVNKYVLFCITQNVWTNRLRKCCQYMEIRLCNGPDDK